MNTFKNSKNQPFQNHIEQGEKQRQIKVKFELDMAKATTAIP